MMNIVHLNHKLADPSLFWDCNLAPLGAIFIPKIIYLNEITS